MSESSESCVMFRIKACMHEKIRAYFKLVPLGVIERHLFGEIGVYGPQAMPMYFRRW